MLATTHGIVLHKLKYADSSLIVKIYTEAFGIQSYLVNGVRSPKAKIKAAFFQALSLLEMVVYHKNQTGLQRIKEIKVIHPLQSVYSDASKNAIAIFISEILYKSLKEECSNPALFEFLKKAILDLESQEKTDANFHLKFLAEYSQHLGFYPQIPAYYTPSFFDLKQGCFRYDLPVHSYFISKELSKSLFEIFESVYDKSSELNISLPQRRSLLQAFITYYELHLTSFYGIKSHEVLAQLSG
jgi:DNA repair protein RecO (recombination protein O)